MQHVRQNSFELEIEDSDVVSDRGQDGHRMPMDVTGYVVQLKKTGADWAVAESREFERSESSLLYFADVDVIYTSIEARLSPLIVRLAYIIILVFICSHWQAVCRNWNAAGYELRDSRGSSNSCGHGRLFCRQNRQNHKTSGHSRADPQRRILAAAAALAAHTIDRRSPLC